MASTSSAVCAALAEEVVGQQRAELVAGEGAPAAVGGRVGYGHREPVGVGVVGQHEVGADLRRQGQRQVERAGLLRVREGDGREVGVGLDLLATSWARANPAAGEGPAHGLGADAVHRPCTR